MTDTNPQSPRILLDNRGSLGNLNCSDRRTSQSLQRLNCNASKFAAQRNTVVGKNASSNYDTPKSPLMLSSPGNSEEIEILICVKRITLLNKLLMN